MLRKAKTLWQCPWSYQLSEAPLESCLFIGWLCGCHPQCSYIFSLNWRMCHLLLRFLCLHEAAILALLLRFSGPISITFERFFFVFHFGDCSSGTLFSLRWSAMEYRCYQPPCSRFIASDDTQSKCVKCMGFLHTREAVFGISKCNICRNLHLKPFHSRLEVFRGNHSFFPTTLRRSLRPSVNPRPGAR